MKKLVSVVFAETPTAELPAAASKDRVSILSPQPPRPCIERARSRDRQPRSA